MSDALRLMTPDERDRLYAARKRGGACAGCGRPLGIDEPVYWERFWVGMKLFGDIGSRRSRNYANAPVGAECVSPEFLTEAEAGLAERCASCGRTVYYRTGNPNRLRVACSDACRYRAKKVS